MNIQKFPNKPSKSHLDSESYRQWLVRDGNRRFQEWHCAFLAYQKRFLQEIKQS
ncbi:MAG: hypothetical protein NW237_07380 [Cyanobacteriota bacterium]|nr:hypothetical protein [Cyanobacteriota bacterium]